MREKSIAPHRCNALISVKLVFVRNAARENGGATGPDGEFHDREHWRMVFIATDMSEASGHAARKAHELGLLDKADVTFA